MSINSSLKREGIKIVRQLNSKEVNTIAISVASKLCLAFPEHNLDRRILFDSISNLKMFVANMSFDSAGAKYYYKDNSIYFNENINPKNWDYFAMHECLHFIQEIRDENNKLTKMGLYNPIYNSGLGLNEAAVQLMASEANMEDINSETYFNISIKTISPDCYPLECALVNQITYFTGTYPLFHSTLYCNDIFKNTFTLKSDEKTYYTISKNLDKLLELENSLNILSCELEYSDKLSKIKHLNKQIIEQKKLIQALFFKTQNLIIEKCFKNEFNSIRNENDIKDFTKKLYNFKNIMGYTDDYNFYNEFYCEIMNSLDKKREVIQKYGEINLFENLNTSLALVDKPKTAFLFISTFIVKIKKLFKINKEKENEINL